jgi:CRP/FNR family transcriptional regulator, cyclic AMP receptor protein
MDRGDLLAAVSLFEGLADDDRNDLAARLEEHHFKPGQAVFAKGDPGASMYIVLSGAVQIFLPTPDADAPPVILKDLHTGDYFGEFSLFDNKPRSASAQAVVETVLLQLTREEFTEQLTKSKAAALTILGEMSQRLRETNALLSQRAATNVVKEIEENLTWGQRLADKVAELNGSWAFILFIVGLTVGWSMLNLIKTIVFDGYPYPFYNLALTILVSLQGPLIVMSQNRENTKDRAKAEADFRVNLKNEIGIESFARELKAFRVETEKRLENVERIRKQRSARESPTA